AEIQAPAQADRYRLIGTVRGAPPHRGRLVHHGWEAARGEVPEWSGNSVAAQGIAPVEVEVLAENSGWMMVAKYVIGIDLGATNSALAVAAPDAGKPQVQVLPIPQLVAGGTVEARTLLPSFLYLAQEHEVKARSFDLSKAKGRDFAVGELARRQAAEMPDRTVGAAKSWLGPSKVDRHQPMIPWDAATEIPKISPVTASQRYLEHLAAAWHAAIPEAPIADQQVVLTVPASFDASARDLTREAALAAGLPQSLVLLEEPQ